MTKLIPADYQTFLTNNIFFPFMKYLAVKSVRMTSTSLSKFPKICPDSGTGYSQRIRQILSGLTLGVGQKIANLVRIRTLPPLPLPRVLVLTAIHMYNARCATVSENTVEGVYGCTLYAKISHILPQSLTRGHSSKVRALTSPCLQRHIFFLWKMPHRALSYGHYPRQVLPVPRTGSANVPRLWLTFRRTA